LPERRRGKRTEETLAPPREGEAVQDRASAGSLPSPADAGEAWVTRGVRQDPDE